MVALVETLFDSLSAHSHFQVSDHLHVLNVSPDLLSSMFELAPDEASWIQRVGNLGCLICKGLAQNSQGQVHRKDYQPDFRRTRVRGEQVIWTLLFRSVEHTRLGSSQHFPEVA